MSAAAFAHTECPRCGKHRTHPHCSHKQCRWRKCIPCKITYNHAGTYTPAVGLRKK